MGLKIFESYKDNKHTEYNKDNKINNECKNSNNSKNSKNSNNSKNSKNSKNDTSKYDDKINKQILTINLDINNDTRDELYSLHIINNV